MTEQIYCYYCQANFTEQGRESCVLRNYSKLASQGSPRHLMCSQSMLPEHSTGFCPEPDESILHPPTLFPY
jgi:hypothetical protein